MNDPLKIGLILDQWKVEEWKFLLVKELLSAEYSKLLYINVLNKPRQNNILLSFHRYIDKILFKPGFDPMRLRNLSVLIGDSEKLETEKLDVIIYLGHGIISDDIIKLAKYGVWSLKFFNKESQPTSVPGYLEVINGVQYSISAIHVQSKEFVKGRIVEKSFSRIDAKSITLTQEMIYARSISLIPNLLKKVYHQQKINLDNFEEELLREKNDPNFFQIVSNSVKHFKRIVTEYKIRKTSNGQWFLLYQSDSGNDRLIDSGKNFIPLYPPDGLIWADPFVISLKDRHYIFYEELPYSTNRGHISCTSIHSKTGSRQEYKEVLKKDYHLSYPFLFHHNGILYMIPESCESKNIELYQCEAFPNKWRFVRNLMENVNAVDTTLFYHNDCWWMFSSLALHQGAIHDDELHLFYSDNPTSKNWEPHPCNPIISDVRKARMAGNIFIFKDKIIRPGQDCSGTYGKSIVFNEILVLSKKQYGERSIHYFNAEWDHELDKTHTYNKGKGIEIIDAYRRIPKQ